MPTSALRTMFRFRRSTEKHVLFYRRGDEGIAPYKSPFMFLGIHANRLCFHTACFSWKLRIATTSLRTGFAMTGGKLEEITTGMNALAMTGCHCRGGHWPSVQNALPFRRDPVWKRTMYCRTSDARPYTDPIPRVCVKSRCRCSGRSRAG